MIKSRSNNKQGTNSYNDSNSTRLISLLHVLQN